MIDNVIQLRNASPNPSPSRASLPLSDAPLSLTIPPELARSIRFTAGMAGKAPEKFVLEWLKSGFPENAA